MHGTKLEGLAREGESQEIPGAGMDWDVKVSVLQSERDGPVCFRSIASRMDASLSIWKCTGDVCIDNLHV